MSGKEVWLRLIPLLISNLSVLLGAAASASGQAAITGRLEQNVTTNSRGNYIAVVTLMNNTSTIISSATISRSATTLGTGALISAPAPIAELLPGASVSVTLEFPPNSILVNKGLVFLQVGGAYALSSQLFEGNWALAFRVWLARNIYYVDPINGSDSNDGASVSTAWKTICKADMTLTLETNGAIVNLLPGQYDATNQLGISSCARQNQNGDLEIFTASNGASGQRITYLGPTQYGVNGVQFFGAWYSEGTYTDVWNMEFTGPNSFLAWMAGTPDAGDDSTGNFDTFRFNYVHDYTNNCATTASVAYAGTVNGGYRTHDVTVDSNVIINSGVNGNCPGSAGSGPVGIYLQGPRAIITNNLVISTQGGIQYYHNACDGLIAFNTTFHNYVYGITVGAWDGQSPSDCSSPGGNNTGVIGNAVVDNGWGGGVTNSTNGTSRGGVYFYGLGNDVKKTSFAYNYVHNNFPGSGGPYCTALPCSQNGTQNITFAGVGFSTPSGNPTRLLGGLSGCGSSGCTNYGTNIVGNGDTNLFIDPSLTAPTWIVGASAGSTFDPLPRGALSDAFSETNGNAFCTGGTEGEFSGFSNPCLPTYDILNVSRNSSGNMSIGAFQH